MRIFPLLRLPFLAIQEVFSTWTPFDLINFSLISSKSKMITKSVTRGSKHKNRYKILSVVNDSPDLSIWESARGFCYEMTRNEYENGILSFSSARVQRVKKYSEDILKGYKEWAGYVLEVLSCEIQDLVFQIKSFPFKHKEIIDWLKSQSKSFNSCDVYGNLVSDDCDDVTVSCLLENLKIAEYLTLNLALSDTFQATIPKVSSILRISSGKWVTLQQMLRFDCFLIEIDRVGLTNQELNQFLKSWQSFESNFKLVYLLLGIQNFVLNEESLNIQTFDDHFEITRIDGKVAEVRITSHKLKVRVRQP